MMIQNQKNNRSKKAARKRKDHTTAFLLVCIVILAAAAAWFALSPQFEKQKTLTQQNDLLESIENGNGVIVSNNGFADIPTDFYDDDGTDESVAAITDYLNEEMTEGNPSVIIFYEDNNTGVPVTDNTSVTNNALVTDNALITGIGILTIEKIDARLPVTDGVSEAQLKVAVGHVPQSAPIGGEGNAIIAGHRSYTYGQYFNRLDELVPGDQIKYQPKDGAEMVFEVYEILTVQPDASAIYDDFPGEQILTLHTCTPLRVATHRLLVRAKRII